MIFRPLFVSSWSRRLPKVWSYAIRKLFREEWLTICSSLAFSTMLSIIPVAIIGLGLLPASANYHEIAGQMRQFILTFFVPGVGSVIDQHLDTFTANASSLPVIGIPALFFSGSLLLLEIHGTFQKIFGIPSTVPWKYRLLEFWALLTGVPILASAAVWFFSIVKEETGWSTGGMSLLIPGGVVWIVFLCIYLIFSPNKPSLTALMIGSFSATVLFLVVRALFLFYISKPTMQNVIYGALAVIPLLQVWLLAFWMIALFGAITTAAVDNDLLDIPAPASE